MPVAQLSKLSIFDQATVDVRPVRSIRWPLGQTHLGSPGLQYLERVFAGFRLLPGIIKDDHLESPKLRGVDGLKEPCPGLRQRREADLPEAKRVLLAAA